LWNKALPFSISSAQDEINRQPKRRYEMLANTKLALAAALILGTASAALATSEHAEDRGGSLAGAYPVYHSGKADKAVGYLESSDQLEGLSQLQKKGHNR
jgi:hypothetical protein